MKTESYHDTTNLEEPTLTVAKRKGGSQMIEIIAFFKSHTGKDFTASEIWTRVFDGDNKKALLTSVRRAITDLYRPPPLKLEGEEAIFPDPALNKTEIKRDGLYGRPEYAYRFRQQEPGITKTLFD